MKFALERQGRDPLQQVTDRFTYAIDFGVRSRKLDINPLVSK